MSGEDRGPRSELFMREDIRNLLLALDQATDCLDGAPSREIVAFRNGYRKALRLVARAFDVSLTEEVQTCSQSLSRRSW